MGYKDTYETYINLSRRELQGLCKKHNLPANKSQSDLAGSLAAYFKKKNSSFVHTEEASLVLAEGKSQDNTSDDDHDENGNEHNKSQDAKVGNELIPASPILVESSEEAVNIEEATDGINNLNSSTSSVVLIDQDLTAHSPTKTEEHAPPAEPSSDNINLQFESHTKCQNQAPPSQCTCNDKSSVGVAEESSTVTETTTRPASFQFFVASEEGINIFVDLSSTPTDWVQSLKDRTWMDSVPKSCLVSSLGKGVNSSLSSVLSENFQSESVPLASIHSLSEIPIEIENKLGHTQEEQEENTKMEYSETIKGDSKEACEIPVTEPNLLVPCWSGDKLSGEEADPSTELSVLGPPDKVAVLDSASGDGLLFSSDTLDDSSVPMESDSARFTPDKNLKRALDEGSEKLSHNKNHHVAEEGNKSRNFTKVLRSSRTLVEETQANNISVKPRRSPRLISK